MEQRADAGAFKDVWPLDDGYVAAGWTERRSGSKTSYLPRVARFDSRGGTLWDVDLKTGGQARAVRPRGGGFLVAGHSFPGPRGHLDARLTALDGQGRVEWERIYGGRSTDRAYALQRYESGWLVAGTTVRDGQSGYQGWLAHVDDQGELLWERVYGGRYYCELRAIALTDSGQIALAGLQIVAHRGQHGWLVVTDAHGEQLWERTYGGFAR